MNSNKELERLKNNIAINTLIKTLGYSLLGIILCTIFLDGIYNDRIAELLSRINRDLYLFLVMNKEVVMIGLYIIIFSAVLFAVTRNTNKDMIKTIIAVDNIIKEPEKEIKLPNNLGILESKLNNIRIDLITSKNLAKEAEGKKNDLIMYMAHDLKTPLTSVIGYLTLLAEESSIPKEAQEKYIKIALDKSLRVEELTNQFFEITRYNLQNMPIDEKKIDLSILIEQLVDEFYPMMQERHLKCIMNKPEHIYYLGDGDKLARAFGNLLKNAINYSYENTNIEIYINDNKEKIQIVFKNTGDKIPQYKLDKIFDKFYRADESRQSNTGGTGLGLAIAKQIIELHKGKIWVKNDTKLIEFYIELQKNEEVEQKTSIL